MADFITEYTERIRISPKNKARLVKSKSDKKQTDAARLNELLDEFFEPALFKQKKK